MTRRPRCIPAHWTPRYIVDRSLLELSQRRSPDRPWLTAAAVAFLEQWIRPGDRCIEWGAGRSSWWLAERAVDVWTTEHDAEWAAEVRSRALGPGHVQVTLVAGDTPEEYIGAHAEIASVDLAIVDGLHRDRCALRAVDLLRPGGLLVIDNVERYLPSASRSPESLGTGSPEASWQTFTDATAGWRRYWTTNGVTDTAFWFKPAELP